MKKNQSPYIQKKECKCDNEGRIVVDMNLKDDTDFLSAFSANETPVISSEVAEFIENTTQSISPYERLTLRIISDCIDKTEQRVYKDAIKEYYTERYRANDRELKIHNRIALILAILGVFVLAFAVFLDYRIGSVIWAEVVDIAAWVFLWEAVDIKFFKARQLALLQKRNAAFIDMKIEYENP
ncbi:MAG: hypothetical protein E7350_02760 [Clostridiales bacterium]|nr:hypothetical protein [Clostridiales bacterium]